MTIDNSLIKSVSIEALIAKRKAALDMITQALELIFAAQHITNSSGMGNIESWLVNKYNPLRGDSALFTHKPIEAITREIDRSGWQYLMDESGLKTFMDSERRNEWIKTIQESKEIPTLNLSNIRSTFEELHNKRGDMFKDGVVNLFRKLSWDYKTNNPCQFGNKIIMNGMVIFDKRWGFRSSYRNADILSDIERAFFLLDNKPEPDHRHDLRILFQASLDNVPSRLVTDYFILQWFQKGSLHITFRRVDLVQELNRVIAERYPNALPERV